MWFEDFQDACLAFHLEYQNRMILAILNVYIAPMPAMKFLLIPTLGLGELQNGHHGSHLGYWNGMILAILNLHVSSMPPIKFGLNPTYHSEADVI